jgi:Transposase (partial DDE domain)
VVKQKSFERKVMLCIWWNFEGVIHFELVPEGLAINAQLYSQQLERMYAALGERYPALVNRKRVLLQQDNARPHTAHLTQEKIAELGRGGHRALAPSSSQFRPCAIGLPPIPVPVDGSFPAWTALRE